MPDKKQYIYFLRLIPRLLPDENWTEQDRDIVARHFARLQALLAEGKLILAGRTQGKNPCGIVILKTDTEEEARVLMEGDPAVAQGIMTAEFHPYRVALMQGIDG